MSTIPARRLSPSSEASLGLFWNVLAAAEDALRLLRREQRHLAADIPSGWPDGQPGSSSRSETTAVEAAVLAADAHHADETQILDDLRTYAVMFHDSLTMLNRIRRQGGERHDGQRCGVLGADGEPCPRFAVEHRDAAGTIDAVMCTEHLTASLCGECRKRPAETRRGGLCAACKRKGERKAAVEAAYAEGVEGVEVGA